MSKNYFKIVIIAFAPAYLFCLWSVPVLPLDRSHYGKKWNKPLAVLQAFVIPNIIYVFLYQYKKDNFGCIDDIFGLCVGGIPR